MSKKVLIQGRPINPNDKVCMVLPEEIYNFLTGKKNKTKKGKVNERI